MRRISAAGGRAIAVEADVGDERAVAAMVATAREAFGPSSCSSTTPPRSVTADRPWHELDGGRVGPRPARERDAGFVLARTLLPCFAERGGSIVNVSSIRVLTGKPGNLHYTASKAAQIGFTRARSRASCGPLGVRVNALLVGAIKTPDECATGPGEIVSTRRSSSCRRCSGGGCPRTLPESCRSCAATTRAS